jgi:hypothetical protein
MAFTLTEPAKNFVRSVESRRWDQAVQQLGGLPMQQALAACDALKPPDRQELSRQCANKPINGRQTFALQAVSTLFMPQESFSGVIDPDYHEARVFILHKLDERSDLAHKPDRLKQCFYPEYSCLDVRYAVRDLAWDHRELGPHQDKQVALFSTGGFYNWGLANAITAPTGKTTTCGLFVRGCLVAAGYRGITDWWIRDLTIGQMIGWVLVDKRTKTRAYVKYAERGDQEPSPGDIFHISGTPFQGKDKDGKVVYWDSDHVGIILDHEEQPDGSWVWDTVEGGQSPGGSWTRLFCDDSSRKLAVAPPGAGGEERRWFGEKPDDHQRTLRGWIDLDKLTTVTPWQRAPVVLTT